MHACVCDASVDLGMAHQIMFVCCLMSPLVGASQHRRETFQNQGLRLLRVHALLLVTQSDSSWQLVG